MYHFLSQINPFFFWCLFETSLFIQQSGIWEKTKTTEQNQLFKSSDSTVQTSKSLNSWFKLLLWRGCLFGESGKTKDFRSHWFVPFG